MTLGRMDSGTVKEDVMSCHANVGTHMSSKSSLPKGIFEGQCKTVVPSLPMPGPFNTVATPSHQIILLLLHNCNFVTVMNFNINT